MSAMLPVDVLKIAQRMLRKSSQLEKPPQRYPRSSGWKTVYPVAPPLVGQEQTVTFVCCMSQASIFPQWQANSGGHVWLEL
mmetsp:Transcript_51065/g.119518  ORF Transcript_51065/g.119518 Transcript_51065/m.119518 type:complete len:81 (-) Transcript_51065:358-600(-)